MTGGIAIAFGAVGAVLAVGVDFVATTVHGGKPGWGLVVTAFGVGMALGMASANPAARILERDRVFVSSLLAAAGALIVMAAMPNLSWTVVFTVWLGAFCGLAWVSGYTLLQENVVDEYRGRTFAALTTLSRMVLFLSLALFPLLAQVFAWIAQALGGGDFYIGGQRIDLSGTRLSLWTAGGLIIVAALNTRRLLTRYRLSRPVSLALVPKLKRPPATGAFIAFEGVEGAGKGTQIALLEAAPARGGHPRPRHARARRDGDRGADPRAAARPGDRLDRRARRGDAVRRRPRADGRIGDPAGARGGQGRRSATATSTLRSPTRGRDGGSAKQTCCR